jgi:hypothetical protein
MIDLLPLLAPLGVLAAAAVALYGTTRVTRAQKQIARESWLRDRRADAYAAFLTTTDEGFYESIRDLGDDLIEKRREILDRMKASMATVEILGPPTVHAAAGELLYEAELSIEMDGADDMDRSLARSKFVGAAYWVLQA